MIVVEEVAAIEGGGKEAFLEAVATKLAPLVARRADAALRFLGSTIGSTGAWPEAIVQFELDDWRAWARLVAALADPEDRELREWREESAALRGRSRHTTLVALPFSPSLASLQQRQVEAKAFSFVRYKATIGNAPALAEALGRLVALERAAGRELVGAHRDAFAVGEFAVVWGHRDLGTIAARAGSPPVGVIEWMKATHALVDLQDEHWAFAAPGGPFWPRGEGTQVKVW